MFKIPLIIFDLKQKNTEIVLDIFVQKFAFEFFLYSPFFFIFYSFILFFFILFYIVILSKIISCSIIFDKPFGMKYV